MKFVHIYRRVKIVGALILTVALVGVPTCMALGESSEQKNPPRLRRAESFFGLHFDFHATLDDTEIGKTLTDSMLQNLIDAVRPDYLQCDCKGHGGCSSYPTKIGNQAGGFVKDPLRIWRDVTARNGVALYIHYSGLGDNQAVVKHPEWSLIEADGRLCDKRTFGITSYFGPYVDQLLIPQLKELHDEYDVDGVWVDGECWAAFHDYSPAALKAWKEKTGYEDAPRKSGDEHWSEYAEFCRQGFRDYFARYVDGIHSYYPKFQIAGNWAYSSFMPEPVEVNVDFISGDFMPKNSLNSARFQGRYLAEQGMPWDLMAWSFRLGGRPGYATTTKSAVQLQQEASEVLALGGGFQVYFQQKRDASIVEWQIPLMKEVAQFCRERQEYCHKAEIIPQVALLYSRAGLYHSGDKLFGHWSGRQGPTEGILQCLLDGQNAVEVVSEHHLTGGKADRFPVIVVPEWSYLEPAFIEELKQYARNGGRLILIGPDPAKLFEQELGVTLCEEPREMDVYIDYNGRLGGLNTRFQAVHASDKARVWKRCYAENDYKEPGEPVVTIHSYGKGQIAGIYAEMGRQYELAPTTVPRDMLTALIREIAGNQLVRVEGSHYVDVVPTRKNGKLMINLVNTSGSHQGDAVYDDIPTIGPLTVTVQYSGQPKTVRLQPGNRPVPWAVRDGKIRCAVAQVTIHDVLEIE